MLLGDNLVVLCFSSISSRRIEIVWKFLSIVLSSLSNRALMFSWSSKSLTLFLFLPKNNPTPPIMNRADANTIQGAIAFKNSEKKESIDEPDEPKKRADGLIVSVNPTKNP